MNKSSLRILMQALVPGPRVASMLAPLSLAISATVSFAKTPARDASWLVIKIASGEASDVWQPGFDTETGLPIVDLGCTGFGLCEDHNREVRAWVAAHGLPSASMKGRFVSRATIESVLGAGSKLSGDGEVTLPGGHRF